DGFEVAGRRRVHRIRGAGAREPRLVVGAVDVVEQLVFGGTPVDVVVFLGAAIEDARVAGVADLPFELELEVAELVFRHEIADRPVLRQRSIADPQSWRGSGGLVPAPGVERRAVEEDARAGGRRRMRRRSG